MIYDPANGKTRNDILIFDQMRLEMPGQRGGKHHEASLTSEDNQALAAFPNGNSQCKQLQEEK